MIALVFSLTRGLYGDASTIRSAAHASYLIMNIFGSVLKLS